MARKKGKGKGNRPPPGIIKHLQVNSASIGEGTAEAGKAKMEGNDYRDEAVDDGPDYLTAEDEDYVDSDHEGRDGYRRGGYHPVAVGNMFKSGRYVILRKLGWGHFSTVWLVHDRVTDGLAALKIQKSATHYTEAARDEIRLLSQIRDGDPDDSKCCCRLLDTFDHSGPHGKHVCMVFAVLGDNLLALIKRYKYQGIPLPIVRNIARQVLMALDYLHGALGIIHTDLKPENVMLGLPLAPREWRLPARTEASRSLMAAALAERSAPLTKNQKKRLKKRIKKQLSDSAGSVVQAVPITDASQADSRFGEHVVVCPETGVPRPVGGTPARGGRRARESVPEDEPMTPPAPAASGEAAEVSESRGPSSVAGGSRESEGTAGCGAAGGSGPAGDDGATSRPCMSDKQLASPGGVITTLTESGERVFSSPVLTEETLPAANCRIVDFGNACWRDRHFTDDIQTRQYRSPEVIVGQGYDTSTDLWSFACMIFELVTGDLLFDPREARDRSYSRDEDHLALMMELLGPMPISMTVKGAHTPRYFEREGRHLRRIKQLKFWPLGHVLVEKYDLDPAEAEGLTRFLTRMLRFHPESRAKAGELLSDPWLTGDLPEAPPELCALSSRKRRRSSPEGRAGAAGGSRDVSGASADGDPTAAAVATGAPAGVPGGSLSGTAAVPDAALSGGGSGAAEASSLPLEGDPVPRACFSAPPTLAGGADAAVAAAVRGFSPEYCASLVRYGITLADFEARSVADAAAAAAAHSAELSASLSAHGSTGWFTEDDVAASAAAAAGYFDHGVYDDEGGLHEGRGFESDLFGAAAAAAAAAAAGLAPSDLVATEATHATVVSASARGGPAPIDLVASLQQSGMTAKQMVNWISERHEAGRMSRQDLARCLSIISAHRVELMAQQPALLGTRTLVDGHPSPMTFCGNHKYSDLDATDFLAERAAPGVPASGAPVGGHTRGCLPPRRAPTPSEASAQTVEGGAVAVGRALADSRAGTSSSGVTSALHPLDQILRQQAPAEPVEALAAVTSSMSLPLLGTAAAGASVPLNAVPPTAAPAPQAPQEAKSPSSSSGGGGVAENTAAAANGGGAAAAAYCGPSSDASSCVAALPPKAACQGAAREKQQRNGQLQKGSLDGDKGGSSSSGTPVYDDSPAEHLVCC